MLVVYPARSQNQCILCVPMQQVAYISNLIILKKTLKAYATKISDDTSGMELHVYSGTIFGNAQ